MFIGTQSSVRPPNLKEVIMSLSIAILKQLHKQPIMLHELLNVVDCKRYGASVYHAEFVVTQMIMKHLVVESGGGELACTDLAYTQEYSII